MAFRLMKDTGLGGPLALSEVLGGPNPENDEWVIGYGDQFPAFQTANGSIGAPPKNSLFYRLDLGTLYRWDVPTLSWVEAIEVDLDAILAAIAALELAVDALETDMAAVEVAVDAVTDEVVTARDGEPTLNDRLNAMDATAILRGDADLGQDWLVASTRNLFFKSPNVAHGITDVMATDRWGAATIIDTNAGGLQLAGLTDNNGLGVRIVAGSASAPAAGVMTILVGKKSGPALVALSAAEIGITVESGVGASVLQIMGNGTINTEGDVSAGDTNLRMSLSGTDAYVTFDANDAMFYDRTANSWNFMIASTVRLSLTNNHLRVPDGSLGDCALGFNNDGDTGLILQAGANLSLVAGGVEILRMVDATDDVQWMKALVAMGAGGAPTLGTTGGAGPAATAQDSWMRVLDSTGAAFFVPAWK